MRAGGGSAFESRSGRQSARERLDDWSLVLLHARVLTMDPERPRAEAVALAGDRIAAVGSDSEIVRLADRPVQQLDCGGRLLVPGLIDAHAHLLAQAAAFANTDCSDAVATSIEAIVQRLRAAAVGLPPGAWLRGRGYHEAALHERRHPTRYDLDRAAPDRPARLVHASGHASVLNSIALAAVGIDAASEEPPGGSIDRLSDSGEPAGLLLEMEDWLETRLPHPAPAEIAALVARLSGRLLAAGITSVQDLGPRNNKGRAEFLADMVATGRLSPRLTLATGYDAFLAGEPALANGIGRGPVKLMLNETGELLTPGPAELTRRVLAVQRAGRQVAIHATEARSVTAALDALAVAAAEEPTIRYRHRIEHASLTPPELAARMAALGAVAVINPGFLHTHGDRFLRTLTAGDLSALYDGAGLRRAGVLVAAGSDCPVSPPEPLLGITAARGRRTREGRRVPGETLALEAAIALFTSAAAAAAHEEDQKGRVRPGLLADLVLLDEQEGRLQPYLTLLGGRVAWQAGRAGTTPFLSDREEGRRAR